MLEEVHLGLGSGECTFNYWPDLARDLAYYNHLIFKRYGKPIGAVVILDRLPTSEGIVVSGLGLGWWLSVDNDGSIVESLEYIAGNEQLSHGGFDVVDAAGFPLRWSTTEGAWAISPVTPPSGVRAMRAGADIEKDRVLTSTEPREVRPGALIRATTTAQKASGGLNHLRLRTVCEGKFDPPDLLANFDFDVDWVNESEFEGDVVTVDSNTAIIGPCTQPQYLANPSFEDGDLDGWIGNRDTVFYWLKFDSSSGGGGPRSGDGYAACQIVEADASYYRWLENENDVTCSGGQKFRLNGYVREGTRTIGEARLVLVVSHDTGVDYLNTDGLRASDAYPGEPAVTQWKQQLLEYEGKAAETVTLAVQLYAVGAERPDGVDRDDIFEWDDVTLTRIQGNTARLTSPEVDVTPGIAHRLTVPVTGSWPESGPTRTGTIEAEVRLIGDGRPDRIVVSSTIDAAKAATHTDLVFDVTPPSGYDKLKVSLVATDLIGGNVSVGRPTLRSQETSRSIVDLKIGPDEHTWTDRTSDLVAPVGTEKAYVELVAEAGDEDDIWDVDQANWHRREAAAAVTTAIDDLLRHNDTGEYLVGPGTINAPGTLAEDWRVTKTPNRNALLDLLAQRVSPPLEYRHRPNNTIDVATADELFVVRELVLTSEKLLVLDEPKVKFSVEDRLSDCTVIGATVKRPAPLPDATVTGSYHADIEGAVDWFGNPVRRRRLVTDTGVEYQAGADTRAQTEVETSAAIQEQITFGLADWIAYEQFDVGDWLGSYKREALWEDRTNPQRDRRTGERIFPRLSRVLDRKFTGMARGDGFSIHVRLPDGTEKDVSRFAQWSDKTGATVTLGDQRANFANDPQGPAAGVRLTQDRARAAR